MPWLQKLGNVTHDYSHMTMEFNWQGHHTLIQGLKSLGPRQISLNQFQMMINHDEVHGLFELVTRPVETKEDESGIKLKFRVGVSSIIQELLLSYKTIFQVPSELPPKRRFDHRIYL